MQNNSIKQQYKNWTEYQNKRRIDNPKPLKTGELDYFVNHPGGTSQKD